jgi:hypothetical protein
MSIMKICTFIINTWGGKNFIDVKVSRQHPLVLLIKVYRNQGRALESEEGRVTGTGLFLVCSRGQELRMWVGFFFVW